MPPSIHRLAALPVEILEQILLHLPVQDILRMEAVSQQFLDLNRGSPALQYRRELLAAGLVDNPLNSCDLEERRRLCKEYVDKWSDPTTIAECLRKVPLERPLSDWNSVTILGGNHLAIHSQPSHIDFLHIPPTTSRKGTERWSIPQFPFEVLHYTAYPPEKMLVVAEERNGFIRIHLLNLSDGSPFRVPPFNVIVWEPPLRGASIKNLAVTGSRLMAIICHPGEPFGEAWRVVVWDWKTGGLVFDSSSVNGLDVWGCQVAFLDEFRVMIVAGDIGIAEIVVVNTLVSQDHPRSFRRLGSLPPKYLERSVDLYFDRDGASRIAKRDGPLAADPTQAILIIDLSPTALDPRVLLILRTQCLIEYACSKRTDVDISWYEWGRGVMTMEIPRDCRMLSAAVHGARVLATYVTPYRSPNERRYIHTFDFSRGGLAIPLLDGTERRAEFKDGRSCLFEGYWRMESSELRSLGDIIVFPVKPAVGHHERGLRVFYAL